MTDVALLPAEPAPGFSLTPVGLDLAPGLTLDEMVRVGRMIADAGRVLQWATGDWLKAMWRDHGIRYGDACAMVGLAYDTSARYHAVADLVPADRRRPDLTWSHHMEVAHVDDPAEQVRLLAWAAKDDPDPDDPNPDEPRSSADLRDKIRREEATAAGDDAPVVLGPARWAITVQCAPDDSEKVAELVATTAEALTAWADQQDLTGFRVAVTG